MEKKMQEPKIEFIRFECEDIICSSTPPILPAVEILNRSMNPHGETPPVDFNNIG